MRIIGPPTSTLQRVNQALANMPATTLFTTEIVPALWNAAARVLIDPVGVIAQSYKETGGGSFLGKVKPQFYNTCGLKVRHQDLFPELGDDKPLAHAMFASWAVGAEAHVQHLRAYAGYPVPLYELVVDPRYTYALRTGRLALENFEDLGGLWAPAPTYGTEIVTIARKLQEIPT